MVTLELINAVANRLAEEKHVTIAEISFMEILCDISYNFNQSETSVIAEAFQLLIKLKGTNSEDEIIMISDITKILESKTFEKFYEMWQSKASKQNVVINDELINSFADYFKNEESQKNDNNEISCQEASFQLPELPLIPDRLEIVDIENTLISEIVSNDLSFKAKIFLAMCDLSKKKNEINKTDIFAYFHPTVSKRKVKATDAQVMFKKQIADALLNLVHEKYISRYVHSFVLVKNLDINKLEKELGRQATLAYNNLKFTEEDELELISRKAAQQKKNSSNWQKEHNFYKSSSEDDASDLDLGVSESDFKYC